MADFDVVVIGAGNGGLTSAVHLAQNGLKVMLLERHNIPGGCATSFVRGRFEFEVALHQLSGMGSEQMPGPLRSTLAELGVLDKVEFVEMPNLYRAIQPDVFDITLKAERGAVEAELSDQFPHEAQGIKGFFDLIYNFSLQLVSAVFLRDPEASKEKYPLYCEYALKPLQEVLDDFFKDPNLQLVLSMYWSYMGLPPRRLPFGDFAIMLWAYIEFKPYHMKGGSQALSSALLDSYLKAGGQARFNCGASGIIVDGARIRGVETEEGDEIRTDRVVSNAGTFNTYVELIDREHVPTEQLQALGARTVGPSAFTVYIGLDCDPGDLNIVETTNFICNNPDSERAYALARTLSKPEFGLLTCYDVDDPGFSPPGACQAALVTLQYSDPWLGVSPAQYTETKNRFAQSLLELAETVFPGFCSHIEEAEAATPLTHMRYLGHPGGAIYGFDQYAKDSNLFDSARSPITGLYFAGAWVGSGGFQPTLQSGVSAAKAILKSMKQ